MVQANNRIQTPRSCGIYSYYIRLNNLQYKISCSHSNHFSFLYLFILTNWTNLKQFWKQIILCEWHQVRYYFWFYKDHRPSIKYLKATCFVMWPTSTQQFLLKHNIIVSFNIELQRVLFKQQTEHNEKIANINLNNFYIMIQNNF